MKVVRYWVVHWGGTFLVLSCDSVLEIFCVMRLMIQVVEVHVFAIARSEIELHV